MLTDAQKEVVLDAYDSKYGTKGPRDKHGFPRASYRWHGFLAAYELLMPVIEAKLKDAESNLRTCKVALGEAMNATKEAGDA